jgi:uncharacterized protein YqeY
MSLKQRLETDLRTAVKAQDKMRVACLRMLKSKILEKEVSFRGKRGADYVLTDEEAVEVIGSYGKQRKDSIESFRQGGRDDLVAKEQAELKIIQEYLPEQMSEDEIRSIVLEAIAEAGATSAKDMGAVMKVVMPRVKGAADGKLVNRIVREQLAPRDSDQAAQT